MKVFGIELTEWGPTALVALFVILIFLGVWRPGREIKQWQTAAEKSAAQVDRLIESVEPMVKFIRELKEQRERELRDLAQTREKASSDRGGGSE